MQRLRLIGAVAVSIGLVAAAPALAQSTATLQGTVTDAQSAVMPGVSITIHNTATNQDRSVVTDAAGAYVAAALAPGSYEITAHIEGFQDQKRQLDLGPAQTVALNLKLTVGALAENVTVTGASPLIDTATVSVGQVMAEKAVQEIPLNGRHFVDLGPLMPGGSTSPQNAGLSAPLRGQGSFSFMSAGNRETSVNMMVNGINLNDLSNSQVTFQPSINTVSEFKVDNSTFSAEYGRNSGAIVNVATRSGSNQLHGEAFDFYRDQKFDSRNYFNPASLDASGNETPQSKFNRKQFGFNLGGPVAKNRSFFFGSYEGLRHEQGVDLNSGTLTNAQRAAVTDPVAKNLLAYIPVANDLTGTRAIGSPLAPVTIDQYTIDSRNNLRDNDDLHLYYAFQRDSRIESNAQGQTVAGYSDTRGGHRQIMTANETHVFSQALVNEVRAGYNRISINFDPNTLVDTNAIGINVGQTTMPIALPDITISGPGLRFGGPGGFPSGREVTTVAIGDTATYLRGNHIIKFGGEYRHVKHYNFNQDPGAFTYPSVAAFQQGFGSQFSITLGTRAYNALVNAVGGFIQDSISLGSNLKLDVGLRYDYLPSPTEQDNKLVTFDPATVSLMQIGTNGFTQVTKNGSDFQPRLGVIWNPTGNGKTVVRGAYAVMVNQSNTGYFTGETGNPPIVSPFSGQAAGTAASNIKLDTAVTQAGAAALAPSFTDPNFLPGRMQTWNANVEREFGGTGVMVGYFGSHGDRQRIPINLNQFTTAGGTVRPYVRLSASSPILPGTTLGNITDSTSLGWSDYKGLWVTANRRMSHGLQLQGSYTLSKSTDTNSYDGTLTAQNNLDLAESVGPSDFDVRHRFSVNATYELPFHGNRLKDGWQLVVVEQAQTGNPFNIVTNIATITGTATVRPDLIGALPSINPHPNNDSNGFPVSYQWFDGQTTVCDPRIAAPAAGSCNASSVFALPYSAAGVAHFGSLGRNVMYGPGFGNTDFSIIKNLALQGSARVQFRVVIFNLFNQANFGQPGRTATVGSTSFGIISNTRFPTGDSGSSRQVQFAAKFLF
ncbi:MAG TPA: carboxypeptidase regulatory-like domain-containing protein [Vicinamibacterales bacterium]|nr:carboxypeptidase regulatory-like domain-containing protein [Vicinamibacterales bacterium]